jgi:peroxiredoxin
MQTLYEKMQGKDFAMLASSYEKDFDKIKNFIEAREFTFDVAQDADQSLVKNYPSVMPTSYIIDKKGNVIASMDGSTDWSQEKYIKLFELLVKM